MLLRVVRTVGLSVNTGLSTWMIFGEKWTTFAIGLLFCDVDVDGVKEVADDDCGDLSDGLLPGIIGSLGGDRDGYVSRVLSDNGGDVTGVSRILRSSLRVSVTGEARGEGGSLVETTSIVTSSSSSASLLSHCGDCDCWMMIRNIVLLE